MGFVTCGAIGLGAKSTCLQILAWALTSLSERTRRVDSRSAHAEKLGRPRHVQTRHLWVQQLKKEPGDTNVSDVLTSPGSRVWRWANIFGAEGVMTTGIRCFWQHAVRQWCSGARVTPSGGQSSCRTWRGAGWWHVDLRQDVNGQIWDPRRPLTQG